MNINKGLLKEIKAGYKNNPYHNFFHADDIASQLRLMTDDIHVILAGYLHDIGHSGKDADTFEEEKSAEQAEIILTKHNFKSGEIQKIQDLIIATKLNFRSELSLYESQLIADADISNIGRRFNIFLENSIRLHIEMNKGKKIKNDDILAFFRDEQPKFFSFLLANNNTPFLTDEANELFDNFHYNKEKIESHLQTKSGQKYLVKRYREIEKLPKIQAYLAS